MDNKRVWLRHGETGGYFHCPAEAIDDWAELGWQPADGPPDEPNPVVAELLAWQADQHTAQQPTTQQTSAESGPETEE